MLRILPEGSGTNQISLPLGDHLIFRFRPIAQSCSQPIQQLLLLDTIILVRDQTLLVELLQ